MDWLNEARREVADLEKAMRANPKSFHHRDSTKSTALDGAGIKRVKALAPELEDLARRVRGLVRA